MTEIETDQVYEAAATRACELLAAAQGPTLLLLSGGSAIGCYELLATQLENCENLTVGLIDERYDIQANHVHSNAVAIEATGLPRRVIQLGGRWEPMLHGAAMPDEVLTYSRLLDNYIDGERSTTIGLIGIGMDGHTAGILPSENAAWFRQTFESDALVSGYDVTDQYKQRMTLTLSALKHIDHLVLVGADDSKRPVIQEAMNSSAPHYEMPATIIQEAREVTVIMSRGK